MSAPNILTLIAVILVVASFITEQPIARNTYLLVAAIFVAVSTWARLTNRKR